RPDALALPAGGADLEGGRCRSCRRRLVRHVAAGGLITGLCKEAEHGCDRGAGPARRQGETERGHADSGRLDAGAADNSARRRHRALAADRESDGLQDHELTRTPPATCKKMAPRRGPFFTTSVSI